MIAVLIFAAKVAACVVAACAAGLLIAEVVHFTFSFLWEKVRELLKLSDTSSVLAVDTGKAKDKMEEERKKICDALSGIAETARREGNVKSLAELEKQDQELKAGIDALDALQRQGASQLLGRVNRNREVTDFEAFNNQDSQLDPEVEKHLKDGTLLIDR